VLSGAPAVAVVCAGLCAPGGHHEQTERADPACHGRSGDSAAITGELVRDCGDHGAAATRAVASLVTSRDDAAMHPAEAAAAHVCADLRSPGAALTSLAGWASPPLPARSSRVLRI
jgi:hypothetical protein